MSRPPPSTSRRTQHPRLSVPHPSVAISRAVAPRLGQGPPHVPHPPQLVALHPAPAARRAVSASRKSCGETPCLAARSCCPVKRLLWRLPHVVMRTRYSTHNITAPSGGAIRIGRDAVVARLAASGSRRARGGACPLVLGVRVSFDEVCCYVVRGPSLRYVLAGSRVGGVLMLSPRFSLP